MTVGAPLAGQRVLLIDDVLTAGTAIRESLSLLAYEKAEAVGVVVALDRQEKMGDNDSALQQLANEAGLHCEAIVTLADLLHYVRDDEHLSDYLPSLTKYRKQYGV